MNSPVSDPLARRGLKAAGVALLTLAGIVLFGRFAGVPWLVTLLPGAVPMAFPTAMGFVGLGYALLAHGAKRLPLGGVAAVYLVLVGVGTLTLYTLAEPLGIRRFIYDPANPVIARGVGFDGRMSPNAAGAFAVVGLAVLFLRARKAWLGWAAGAIALVLAVALLSLVSYATGLRSAVAWWRYTAMALHTALGFFLAGAALLWWLMGEMARAQRIATRTLPFFVVAAATVVALGAIVLVSNEQRQEAARLENHALQVEVGIDRFIASVARLESSTRAFALTGDEQYMARIEVHRESVAAAAEALVALTEDTPQQHARALALRPLVAEKFTVNQEQVEARRRGGAAAAAVVLRKEAPELMRGLRAITEGLQQHEQQTLLQRRAETMVNERRLQWVLLAGAVLTSGLVAGAFVLVHRAQRELQGANEQLEDRVRQRTAELETSAGQLRGSERRLQFLADMMPQLVWTARADGIIESLNRGWLEYLGVTTQAEALTRYAKVVHPDDLSATSRTWERMLREQRAAGGEARLRRGDGEYRWHLWRAHPERDAQGAVVRWVGTWTDIHDQKSAEEQLERRVAERTAELAESEARFRQAFDFAGIGMALVGMDGRWLRVNRAICDIVGYTEAELLQKTFQDITHPEDLAADLALLDELVAGKRRFYQMQKRYFHREGHVVWVRLTVSAVRDAKDNVVHFISQIEDVTAQKQLEESLARARDQAVEASRMKSEFLATMSHEIRTPMNGVIGMTTLLRDTPLTPTQAEYVRTIEASGEALLAIINDILDYSKVEAGRIELEVVPFDLRQCVQDAIDLFLGKAAEKGLELDVEFAAGVPEQLVGDATRLRQVLVNLLSNAVKFTEKGAVRLKVDAKNESGRVRLQFAVQDTGIGIPPEGMARLFKSFSQVDASTTRRFGGTGLGLAISKRLAELMGGAMWAESKPGEGSTFHFTVLVQERSEGSGAAVASGGGATLDGQVGTKHPLRLLVAEDNAVNQRVAMLLLKRIGYRATMVANGLEAVEAAERTDFDAILMDVEMPEIDGCEATRRIRAQRGSATRPWIIALTAGAMRGDRERALAAGMNDFVTKPVRVEALAEALVRAHGAVGEKGGKV